MKIGDTPNPESPYTMLKSHAQRRNCWREWQEVSCKHGQSETSTRSRALHPKVWEWRAVVSGTGIARMRHGAEIRWGQLKVSPRHSTYSLQSTANTLPSNIVSEETALEKFQWLEYQELQTKGEAQGHLRTPRWKWGQYRKACIFPAPSPPTGLPRVPSDNDTSPRLDTGGLWETQKVLEKRTTYTNILGLSHQPKKLACRITLE